MSVASAGLHVRSLSAGYDADVPILKGIDLVALPGRITGIIGPNGSGKSTLLNTICGFAQCFSGSIWLAERRLNGLHSWTIARSGIIYIAQERALFPFLSVADNLEMAAWVIKGNVCERDRRERDVFDSFPFLSERRRDKAGTLSGGQQRLLEVAFSRMRESRVLLFDEPSAGLTPNLTTTVYENIKTISQKDKVVVVVDQNVRALFGVADTIYELRNGTVTLQFDPTTTDPSRVVGAWLSAVNQMRS